MKDIFKKKDLGNGINLYICPTNKFKTTTIHFFLHSELKRKTATMTALLPFVLKRGSENFPSARSLNLYLENLYGATIGTNVLKRGEIQVIQFFAEVINSEYVKDKNLLDNILYVLRDIILNPCVEEGYFKTEYVEQEKDVLRRVIESLYNDKLSYSIERCFQEMCRDENFSIFKYGNIEDLNKIDNKILYKHYQNCLKSNPIDIFILGNIKEDEVYRKIKKIFNINRKVKKRLDTGFLSKKINKEKFIVERQEVNQGKLSLGFRTNTRYGDKDYYPLLVYNGILGGGPHSKLFQNVREAESLAYYIFSTLENTKGLMLISCGIEFENKDKALEIIKKQLDDIRNGNISDYEFDSTIKSLKNSYKEIADSPGLTVGMYLDGIINDVYESPEGVITNIERVTKQGVINVAEKIQLDTIYFLDQK